MTETLLEDNERIEQLVNLLSNNISFSSIQYNGAVLSFDITGNYDVNYSILEYFFKDVTKLLGHKIEVKLSSSKFSNVRVFYEENDFLNKYEQYRLTFTEDYLLIISQSKVITKHPNEEFSTGKAQIFNYLIYRKLLEFLMTKPEFTPYHDDLKKQFVIISNENGAFHIGYNLLEKNLNLIDDLKPAFDNLQVQFEKIEFTQFFKEGIISAIHQFEIKDRFFQLVKNLDIIISFADRDHQAYVLKFAFDKIKSKFKEERNKYFESIDKSIETVSKQVTSFPLTFAATIFASYQVKDKPLILGFILFAYILYTYIAWKVIDVASYNSTCIRRDVLKEKKTIKNTYKILYADFKYDFSKIFIKLRKLNMLIYILRWILILLLLIFAGFTVLEIISTNTTKNTLTLPLEKVNIIVEESTSEG